MKDYYKGKNVLVTGGCGFIGSNTAINLVALGAKVTIMDSMLPRFGGNIFNLTPVKNDIQVNFSDLRDEHSLPHIVKDKDIIFNLAGQISHADSMSDPMADLDINCRAQLSLLQTCHRYNPAVKIIYASTRQIYGKPQCLPVKEDHIIAPVDVNGINKAAGEWYHSLYHRVHDLNTCSLRLTNVYGPRQAIGLNNQGFIGIFLRKAILNEKISIFGDGNQLRDLNHVDDVVNAFLACGANHQAIGKTYNLGHHHHHTLNHLIETLHQLTGVDYQKIRFPAEQAKIDIGDYYADYSFIKNDLGWTPQIDLAEGMEITLNYFKERFAYYCP